MQELQDELANLNIRRIKLYDWATPVPPTQDFVLTCIMRKVIEMTYLDVSIPCNFTLYMEKDGQIFIYENRNWHFLPVDQSVAAYFVCKECNNCIYASERDFKTLYPIARDIYESTMRLKIDSTKNI